MRTIRSIAAAAQVKAEISKQTAILDGLVRVFEEKTSHLSTDEQIGVAWDLCNNGSDRQTAEVAAVWLSRQGALYDHIPE